MAKRKTKRGMAINQGLMDMAVNNPKKFRAWAEKQDPKLLISMKKNWSKR